MPFAISGGSVNSGGGGGSVLSVAGRTGNVTLTSTDIGGLGALATVTPGTGIATALGLALGAANGFASLDGSGKLASSQIPTSVTGALNYQGTWNATTNSPTLVSSTGTKGFFYKVATAGTTTIDGISQWNVGDSIVFDGTTWDKIDGVSSEVLSVAGKVGAVSLVVSDISNFGSGVATALTVAANGAGGFLTNGTNNIPNSALPTIITANTTGIKVAPVGSVGIIMGDSYSAGFPVNSVDGTLGFANAYVGPGMCYPQWLSTQPFFATNNIPIYSYGISGAKGSDTTGVGSATKILAGTGTLRGTCYINGVVTGAGYGGITVVPSSLLGANNYWVWEYGINDVGAIAFSGFLTAMQSVFTTIHGYSGKNYIVATSVPEASNVTGTGRAAFNYGYKSQVQTGLTSGADAVALVDSFFNNNINSSWYSGTTHLNSAGYQVFAFLVDRAFESGTDWTGVQGDALNYISSRTINLGDGSGAVSVNLSNNAQSGFFCFNSAGSKMGIYNDGTGVGILTITGAPTTFYEAGTVNGIIDLNGNWTFSRGNAIIGTAGKGLQIKAGRTLTTPANMTSGSLTFSDTSLAAGDEIIPFYDTPDGTNDGALYLSSRTNGTGYTIKSTNASSTAKIGAMIVHQN